MMSCRQPRMTSDRPEGAWTSVSNEAPFVIIPAPIHFSEARFGAPWLSTVANYSHPQFASCTSDAYSVVPGLVPQPAGFAPWAPVKPHAPNPHYPWNPHSAYDTQSGAQTDIHAACPTFVPYPFHGLSPSTNSTFPQEMVGNATPSARMSASAITPIHNSSTSPHRPMPTRALPTSCFSGDVCSQRAVDDNSLRTENGVSPFSSYSSSPTSHDASVSSQSPLGLSQQWPSAVTSLPPPPTPPPHPHPLSVSVTPPPSTSGSSASASASASYCSYVPESTSSPSSTLSISSSSSSPHPPQPAPTTPSYTASAPPEQPAPTTPTLLRSLPTPRSLPAPAQQASAPLPASQITPVNPSQRMQQSITPPQVSHTPTAPSNSSSPSKNHLLSVSSSTTNIITHLPDSLPTSASPSLPSSSSSSSSSLSPYPSPHQLTHSSSASSSASLFPSFSSSVASLSPLPPTPSTSSPPRLTPEGQGGSENKRRPQKRTVGGRSEESIQRRKQKVAKERAQVLLLWAQLAFECGLPAKLPKETILKVACTSVQETKKLEDQLEKDLACVRDRLDTQKPLLELVKSRAASETNKNNKKNSSDGDKKCVVFANPSSSSLASSSSSPSTLSLSRKNTSANANANTATPSSPRKSHIYSCFLACPALILFVRLDGLVLDSNITIRSLMGSDGCGEFVWAYTIPEHSRVIQRRWELIQEGDLPHTRSTALTLVSKRGRRIDVVGVSSLAAEKGRAIGMLCFLMPAG